MLITTLTLFCVVVLAQSENSQMLSASKADTRKPSLALDKNNWPVLAFIERNPVEKNTAEKNAVFHGFVKRWNGSAWQNIGPSINRDPQKNINDISLALDKTGTPVVAWSEGGNSLDNKTPSPSKVHVARLQENTWQEFGNSPSKSTASSSGLPILRLDSKGWPVLSWNELSPEFNANSFFVARWNGKTWTDVDKGSLSTDVSSASRSNDLAITSQDEAMLAWSAQSFSKSKGSTDFNQFIGQQKNGRWTSLGGGSLNISEQHYAASPSIALDAHDNPSIVWAEANAGFDIFCKTWDGKTWKRLGETVNGATGLANNPKLALDAKGNPVVAWLENAGSLKVMVRRWNGRAWNAVGKFLNIQANSYANTLSLALETNGAPVVAWQEEFEKNQRVYVQRWNGKTWVGY